MQVACFEIAGNHYALDIMSIKEVINPLEITSVPHTPPFVEGIIELRGAFLPVIDLRKRLGKPAAADCKIVVARVGERLTGLIVDRVSEVVRIDPMAIEPAPAMAVGPAAPYFVGVTKIGTRIVLLVELEQLLSPGEQSQLAGIEVER